MPAVEVRLTLIEATELAEMLTFRFTFLPGNDHGGQPFDRPKDDPRCDDQT